MRKIIQLTDLANMYGSDKGSKVGNSHRYTYIYDLLFSPIRNKPIRLLEIGLSIGGPETKEGKIDRRVQSPSMSMWSKYFNKATLFGFDISDFSHLEIPKFTFIQGDSGSLDDLNNLKNRAESYDIIIDDGSHASYHQLLQLKVLWPSVSSGGIYIIEDLYWQSPVFQEILPKTEKADDVLKWFFEGNSYINNPVFSPDELLDLRNEVECFAYFPAFDGTASGTKIIFFRKKGEMRSFT